MLDLMKLEIANRLAHSSNRYHFNICFAACQNENHFVIELFEKVQNQPEFISSLPTLDSLIRILIDATEPVLE